ncbi:MAG: endonuclease/exonuclease/phosphatase family protein [Armatimonadetes bacterium]|nr:endonuclease/exonuclease/phosphatase family protein [Armatimonadota bacterium]
MFRIVTYNIKAGLGMDGIRSIRRVGDVLAHLRADVICLQEVDQHIARSWLANQPKLLGIRLDMHPVFQRNLRLDSGWYGNCILVKPPVIHCRFHQLPGGGEPRGLLEVTTSLDGSEVTIFCTHLSTEEPVRVEQALKVAEITRSVRRPKILCGDMNDVRGSKTLANLLSDPVLWDVALEFEQDHAATLIGPIPSRIDFILADLRFKVESYYVVDSNASDHRPVVADLTLA